MAISDLSAPSSDTTRLDHRGAGHRRNISFILLVTSASWLVVLVLFSPEFSHLTLRQISLVMIVSEIAIGILICRTDTHGTWGFPFLYFLVLVVFHSGLYLAPALLGRLPLSYSDSTSTWFTPAVIVRAAYIVIIAVACYAMGYATSRLTGGRDRGPQRRADFNTALRKEDTRAGIVDIGCCLTTFSVLIWFAVSVMNAGPTFFLGSYREYLRTTSGTALPWVYVGLSLGVALCALDPDRFTGRVGLSAFAVFAVPAFLVGLRGEVLFPLVAAVGVLGCGRKLWRARGFWVGCLLILVSISFVSEARIEGVTVAARSSIAVSPFRAIEEMGYSVRPLTTSVRWHEEAREPYLGGATYVAPLDRQIRAFLGFPVPEAKDDYRLMNVEIAARVGPIGGSVIAEAHHNGGLAGVGIIMTLVGFLVGLLFRHPKSAVHIALSGVVAVLLLMHVRNSFAPLPAWAVMGCALVLIGVTLGRIHTRSSLKTSRRALGQNPGKEARR